MTFDQDDFAPRSRRPSQLSEEEEDLTNTLEPSWRTCWICGVKCYRAGGKTREDPGVLNDWVTVDLSGGILVSH